MSRVALSREDRALLAAQILETLDGPADPDAAAAWDAEIADRLRRLERGETGTSPAMDVFAEARRK
jgi:hypothetical protein